MDTRGHQLSPTYNEKIFFFSLFGMAVGINLLSAVNIFLIPGQWTSHPDNGDVNYV